MPEKIVRPTCRVHGHDRYHHAVRSDLKYGVVAWLRMFSGVSGQPQEISFTCSECGETFEVTRDPRILSEFRRYPYVDRKPGT